MGETLHIQTQGKIPLLASTDILVIGGGLAGLSAARECARAGLSAIIITHATFLGDEITLWQRPWFRWGAGMRDLAREWFPLKDVDSRRDERCAVPLPMDALKTRLEDLLIEAGVRILYGSRAVQCLSCDGSMLVTIGNKSGRQAIRAAWVIDTTDNALTKRLSSGVPAVLEAKRFSQHRHWEKAMVRRTMEYTDVDLALPFFRPLPDALGVKNNSIDVYPGSYAADHAYVDVPFEIETTPSRSFEEDRRIDALTRQKCIEVSAHLVAHEPAFARAKIASCSFQTMRGESCDPLQLLSRGLEMAAMICRGEASAGTCIFSNEEAAGKTHFQSENGPTAKIRAHFLRYREENDLGFLRDLPGVDAGDIELPVMGEFDVLVAGGGVSGAPAALAAARRGVRTSLVDMNPILGGTGTIGGASVYWCSNPTAISTEIDRRVVALSRHLKYPMDFHDWIRTGRDGKEYRWSRHFCWGIEIKAHALFEMCDESGVEVFLNCGVIGTLTCGESVAGVVVSTPFGPAALRARITVDATGDGDVAAFAGAGYVYGNARDRSTMCSSLGHFHTPGKYHGSFYTSADMGDVLDFTRFIISARRRGTGLYEHGAYLMPRESRHISGRNTPTLRDQLLMRRFPDTICVAFSNYDMKGKSFADIVNLGINPPNLDIEIPYGALLPRDLENIIVTGKAYSITHDAFAAPRMQKDMQALGFASGLAAAMAVRRRVRPSRIPVRLLQEELAAGKNLGGRVSGLHLVSPAEIAPQTLVGGLTGDEELEWLHMGSRTRARTIPPVVAVYYADGARILPMLRDAHRAAAGKRRLLLARMIAWHGSGEGLEDLMGEIRRIFAIEKPLPRRKGDVDFIVIPPDQGLMPEVLYLVNALVRIRDARCIPIYAMIAERIHEAERDYYDTRLCVMDYMDSIVYAAERLAFSDFIPILQRLRELPEMRNIVRKEGFEADVAAERLAYQAMSVCRAIARCGSREGLFGLIDFLQDNRALIAKSARNELVAITGHAFSLSKDPWVRAIDAWPARFPAQPWTTIID
jgi:flavin-dependent dehydrogenase